VPRVWITVGRTIDRREDADPGNVDVVALVGGAEVAVVAYDAFAGIVFFARTLYADSSHAAQFAGGPVRLFAGPYALTADIRNLLAAVVTVVARVFFADTLDAEAEGTA
jgi:hypothetical protein